jgi:hypothetical protein
VTQKLCHQLMQMWSFKEQQPVKVQLQLVMELLEFPF